MSDAKLIRLSQQFFQSIIEKRTDEIIGRYADSETTYVFVEGPRWSTIGIERIAAGWRAFAAAPLSLESCEWIEGPFSQVSSEMAWIAGIVELKVRVRDETKTVRFRGSFVMRPDAAAEWRIVHEHFSSPAADPYGIGDWLNRKDEG